MECALPDLGLRGGLPCTERVEKGMPAREQPDMNPEFMEILARETRA